MKQKTAIFANTQQEVSRLGLGCMSMSGSYGSANDDSSANVIRRSLDLGCTFLDTADFYGLGHNEELLGKAIQGRRNEIFLATKFGLKSYTEVDGDPWYVKTACERSLKRLQVDTIDLYYLHRLDPKTPIEDTVGAMAELVQEGKVRYLGLSEVSARTLKRAHAIHPISALQSEYSLWWRKPELEILPLCKELGIAFVAYCPLGRGILTGKVPEASNLEGTDVRNFLDRFKGDAFIHNQGLVRTISEIAQDLNVTPGQIALAWLLKQGSFIFPIPGTKTLQYLEENWASLDINLNQTVLDRVQNVLDQFSAQGNRYPEAIEKLIDHS